MRKFLVFGLLILISCGAFAQNFIYDVESIKRYLGQHHLTLQLKHPDKDGVPGVVFTDYMPQHSLFGICPPGFGMKLKGPHYEVLMVLEEGNSMMRMRKDKKDAVHVLLVKLPEEEATAAKTQNYVETRSVVDGYTIRFNRENMDEVIHWSNERVEIIYATGMQITDGKQGADEEVSVTADPSKVKWVKRGDLNLHLIPGFKLNGNFVIQETLGNPNTPAKQSEWQRMQFHTNQVDVQVGPEVKINDKVQVTGKVTYEDSASGKALGVFSGLDVKLPKGAQLMLFTSYKTPVLGPYVLPTAPLSTTAGGAAGVKVRLPSGGPTFDIGVSGVGTERPFMQGGISIPLEKKPKKK